MSPPNFILVNGGATATVDDGSNVGLIAGVCVAAVLVVIIVIVLIVIVKKKHTKITDLERTGTPTGSYQNTGHFLYRSRSCEIIYGMMIWQVTVLEIQ